MKQILSKVNLTRFLLAMSLIVATSLLNSCTNDIEYYELNKPEWLGESIYEQLQQGYTDAEGTNYSFSTYIRLIDDIEYTEVLKKTGSKTLFVSDDAAFERFFESNAWGVKSYDELSLAQKKLIINTAMINNAYLIELMSNTVGPVEGQALRRGTAFSALDSITFEKAEDMPLNYNWDYYRGKGGMYLLKDRTDLQMVHFLQRHMDFKNITSEDFSFIYNGKPREKNDAHIFGNKVVVRDITCKNGYINILDEVLVPPTNMAEIIRTTPETSLFSSILERFAAPYYNQSLTGAYNLYRNKEMEKGRELPVIDSLFSKNYFATRGPSGSNLNDPKGNLQKGYLDYDPGWNKYSMSDQSSSQTDMAAIFAPSNEILQTFFDVGGGKFLIDKYVTIDKIPSDVLADLMNNLMKPSFIGSVPSKFAEVLDDGKEPMGIEKTDVDKTIVGSNGVVYIMNKVYAPASYVAVTAPTLVNDNMKIFRWAVTKLGYDAYLLSMDSHYSFIVPWDQTTPSNATMGEGMYYVDPVKLNQTQPEIIRFWYNEKSTLVNGTAYAYTPETGEIGDSIRLISQGEVEDRLDDMLDYHVVVGNIQDGKKFYRTKGGGELKIDATNVVDANGKGMIIYGGGDINLGKTPTVEKGYDQTKETNGRGNGKTYVVNTPLYAPFKSVYKILSETPEFSEFFSLLQGSEVFYRDNSFVGMDYNVKFFNTYHYSVYVPNNDAMQAAYAAGLPKWDVVNAQTNQSVKDTLTNELNNFVRYHFQDNSVYIDNTVDTKQVPYETAAFSLTGTKSYYRLYTQLTANSLTLYTDQTEPIHVVTDNGLYNIMAREYKFNNGDIQRATLIETSSFAVIHEVDNYLLYNKDQISNLKAVVERASN